jgi:hypothetical protein
MIRIVGLILLASASVVVAQAPPLSSWSNWSFDELILANGNQVQGLILSEEPDGVWFQSVSRLPGRPTVTLTSFYTRQEIARINRLSLINRLLLHRRLAELDPTGEGEQARMESLELVVIPWAGQADAGRRYDSDYFVLESSGSEELTRRSAVRLEQIYTAFRRFLPPTVKQATPTRILLATDLEDYKALLAPFGGNPLLTPAVFDARSNRVLCGHDLKRLSADLQSARIHHSQQLASLKRYEESLRKLYKGVELEQFLKPVERERKRVALADRANGQKFDQATARLFAILYHEAFHAYVGTFVYPPLSPEDVKAGKGTGELPRWLNEGLAQVFQTAVVEAGELRADTPDQERLNRVQDWLRGKAAGHLVPLPELLTTGKETFLPAHAEQRSAADRAYLTSWALAYYLTFERHLIGTPEFHTYLVAINSGGDRREAFTKLVGQDLAAFEKNWHAYLLRLRKDGTLKQ